MSKGGFKEELFGHFATIAKAMGSANRLSLLELLAQGERGVDALARASGLSVANTSSHLQQLRQAGLVTARKDGQRVIYAISGDDVVALFVALRSVSERCIADVERLVASFLATRDELEPVLASELLDRVRSGVVTVIDVRPAEEYAYGHLPGAVNIPRGELEARVAELAGADEIVAYCRGPHCVLAFDAVAELRARGFKARRLDGGYPEWKLAGLPVEAASSPE